MNLSIKPHVTKVDHVLGCSRQTCGAECGREVDGLEYDITLMLPDGNKFRERRSFPRGRSGKWAHARMRLLLSIGLRGLGPAMRTDCRDNNPITGGTAR